MILSIVGKAGAGKDWAYAQLLSRNPGLPISRFAFADLVKYEIEDTLGSSMVLPGLWEKPYSPAVRRLLLWWGTEFRRNEDPDHWVNKAKGHVLPYAKGGSLSPTLLVVTDCRFPNEFEFLRECGASTIKLWAPEDVRRTRLNNEVPVHSSEAYIDDYADGPTLLSVGGRLTPMNDYEEQRWNQIRRELGIDL